MKAIISALALSLSLALSAAAESHKAEATGHHLHSKEETTSLYQRLQDGGLVIFFRHERTNMMIPDQAEYLVEDCASQRNLSVAGIASAREIGENLRHLEIPIGPVLASPMCRTLETARYMFTQVKPADALHGAGRDSELVGGDVRRLAVENAAEGTNAVLVAHLCLISSLHSMATYTRAMRRSSISLTEKRT